MEPISFLLPCYIHKYLGFPVVDEMDGETILYNPFHATVFPDRDFIESKKRHILIDNDNRSKDEIIDYVLKNFYLYKNCSTIGSLKKKKLDKNNVLYLQKDYNIPVDKPVVIMDSITDWYLADFKINENTLAIAVYRGGKINHKSFFLQAIPIPTITKLFLNADSKRDVWSRIHFLPENKKLLKRVKELESLKAGTGTGNRVKVSDKLVKVSDKLVKVSEKPFQPICPPLYDGIVDIVSKKDYIKKVETCMERRWELEQFHHECLICMESKPNVVNSCGHGMCEQCFKKMKIFDMLENKGTKCPQCKESMTERTCLKLLDSELEELSKADPYLEFIKNVKNEKHPQSDIVFYVKNLEQMFKIYEFIINEWPDSNVSRKNVFDDKHGRALHSFYFVFEKNEFPERPSKDLVGLDFTFSSIETEFPELENLYRFFV